MKIKLTHKAASLALLAVSLVTPTLAAPTPTVRYEQASMEPNYHTVLGLESHQYGTAHQQTFDNFRFIRGELITQFRWRGTFIHTNGGGHQPPSATAGDWEISIWSDHNGRPGELQYRETQPAIQVDRTDAGALVTSFATLDMFTYGFELAEPFPAEPATDYWISVVYLAETRQPAFFWAQGATGEKALPQMSWASVLGPVDGALRIDQMTGSEFVLEWANTAMAIVTLPAADADQDGMDDSWEADHGLDPLADDSMADPDKDDSTNFDEYTRRTAPDNPDTDGDGIPDGAETNTGIYLSASDTGTSPLLADSDRDGLADKIEDPTQAFEGLLQPGTDPNQRDSDGDGYADRLEIDGGFNPQNSSSAPVPVVLGTGSGALEGSDLIDTGSVSFDYGQYFSAQPQGSHADLFDNQLGAAGSDWFTQIGDGRYNDLSVYVDVTFETPIILDHFTIASSQGSQDADPVSWEIQGSNDGKTFHTIFHHANPDASIWTARSQVIRFAAGVHYEKPAAFKTIRFSTTPHLGAAQGRAFRLGELEFFGRPLETKLNKIALLEGEQAVRLQWNSAPDLHYAIDRSENLVEWTEMEGALPSQGRTTTFTDRQLGSGLPRSLFYQVRLID